MKINKSLIVPTIVLALIAVLIVPALGLIKAHALSSKIDVRSSNPNSGYATTTLTFILKAGVSTTTVAMFTDNADQVDFNLMLISSTTPPQAAFRYEYSENGVDWFSDDIALAANATSTQRVGNFAEQKWLFASSTGGTADGVTESYKHVSLLNVNSAYTRIVFYLLNGSGPANIWIQARSKSNNPI